MEQLNKLDELKMDYQTYKKISGKLNPKEKADTTITTDKENPSSQTSSSSSMSMATQMTENEGVPTQDNETIKYLSNVKDSKTGQVSKPFSIGEKKYQMVRGVTSSDEVVTGVLCFDEIGADGEPVIHTTEYFEANIAKPMKEQMAMVGQDIQVAPKVRETEYNYADAEKEHHDKEAFMDFLNLVDVGPEFKHFFVDITNGKIIAKFKNTKEMVKSGIKLGPNQDYMDIKTLKRFRFGDYFTGDVNEAEEIAQDGTNINKLQSDVKKLANLIKNKFSVYLTKLDKPIEQAQFLTAMAREIGVPLNKLSSIINSYKDIAAQDKEMAGTPPVANESKIIKKKVLEESSNKQSEEAVKTALNIVKVIKVKDINNE